MLFSHVTCSLTCDFFPQGGSNFGAAYNREELFASDCTSAGISADKSNYWEPQLYWIETNGQFTPIDTISRFYYFLGRVVSHYYR